MISSPSRSSTPTNTTDENLLRCVTPSPSSMIECLSHEQEDDEEDIPHMLNPYSENDDDDDLNHLHFHHPDVDDDHHDDDDDYMQISPSKPIAYRADSPQHWHLPISNGYDIIDSSPVSSISNFSYDQNTYTSIDSGLRKTQKSNNLSNQIMDITSSPKAASRKDGIQPRLRPRMVLMGHGHSSPDHHHVHVIPSSPSNSSLNKKISTLRTPSPTNSLGSKGSPHRNTINGTTIRHHVRKGSREASRSDCLPPPSPRRSTTDTRKKKMNGHHRRSVSLNQIPSSSHTTLIAGQQHRRVQSRGNDDTRQSPRPDHRKNNARSTKRMTQLSPSIPPKHPTIHNYNNTHRRTVSFPDHVLQNNGYSSTTISTTNTPNIGNISPLTLQSDDPALFSLLETTQSSSNGRVYIPNDVDPSIYIPSMNTIRSISPSRIPMNKKDSKNHHHNSTSTSTITTNKSLDNSHQITFDPLVMNSRHYSKKHRRGKSSSGSFSSGENKLASLEENGVFQSDDVTTAFVEGHRKIDASIPPPPPPQVSRTTKEIQRNTSKHQGKLKDWNSNDLIHTKSSNDSFLDNGSDSNSNRSIFRKNKIPTRSKRKEKKTRKNIDDIVPIGTNDSLEKENYVIGENFVEVTKTSKKNKDQCSIQ